MNTKQVAETILDQLGGNRFVAMTGAKNFVYGDKDGVPYLSMKLPRGKHMTIKLDPSDTYTMELAKISTRNFTFKKTVIEESSHVYCDMLQNEFTRMTGLYTYL